MMHTSAAPALQPQPATRRLLKIEEAGDLWEGGVKPKIRLCGRWLERVGFKPGHRVEVLSEAPGSLTIRLLEANAAFATSNQELQS